MQLPPASGLYARKRLTLSPSFFLNFFCKALQQKYPHRNQAAVAGMVTTERSIHQRASGKGGMLEASQPVSPEAQRNTPCPRTRLSRSPLPLLRGKDDFTGRSSQGAQFKPLGLLREGPCLKQRFNPSPTRVCLNHSGKTGRNSSCLLPVRRSQRLKHHSGQTRRCVINGGTRFPSVRHRAEHNPPLPLLHQCAAPYLKPICDNRFGFSEVRRFLRSNWMGVPMPEDAPGGTGRAVLGEVGEVGWRPLQPRLHQRPWRRGRGLRASLAPRLPPQAAQLSPPQRGSSSGHTPGKISVFPGGG